MSGPARSTRSPGAIVAPGFGDLTEGLARPSPPI
jgi:hypothetical protein